MIYLDTSIVVALLTAEVNSAVALDWFADCSDQLVSSDWLITEIHSALGIKHRHYGLTKADWEDAEQQLEQLLSGPVLLRPLDRVCFHQASTLLKNPDLGLRAGVALHLAAALHFGCNQVACFDMRMLSAAVQLALPSALAL